MVSLTLFFVMLVIASTTCGILDSILEIPNKGLNTMTKILELPIQALIRLGLNKECHRSSACYTDDMGKLSLWRFDGNKKTKVYRMNESELLMRDKSFRRNPEVNIWIPGFTDDVDDKASQEVINAYLSIGKSIFFYRTYDYTYSNILVTKSYERSVNYAPCNGMRLAKFLCELFRAGVNTANMHIVGHSLGGQTLGYVGRHFIKLCGKKLPRLTALDPAGPCFHHDNHQISFRDADFVDIINSNRKAFGTEYLLGTANFLPNGEGYNQPQCSGHSLEATKCSSWDSYKSGKCNDNDLQSVGYPASSASQGTYYFHTNNAFRETYSLSKKILKSTSASILGHSSINIMDSLKLPKDFLNIPI